jgi:hypothetical protein
MFFSLSLLMLIVVDVVCIYIYVVSLLHSYVHTRGTIGHWTERDTHPQRNGGQRNPFTQVAQESLGSQDRHEKHSLTREKEEEEEEITSLTHRHTGKGNSKQNKCIR